jgi:hypothetical protein
VPVVALAYQVQIKAEAVDMGFLRPGKCQPTVRGMSCIVDIQRFTATVAGCDAFNLKGKDVGDRGRPLERLNVDLDRLKLDAAEVAN